MAERKIQRQIYTYSTILNFNNASSVETTINVPFQVKKIIVKPIVCGINDAHDYVMRSSLANNEIIGQMSGFYADGVTANYSHASVYPANTIFTFKQPITVNGSYSFNTSVFSDYPDLTAITSHIYLSIEFHE